MNPLHRWIWTVTVAAAASLFLAAASPSWAGQLADGQSQEQARQGAIAPVDLGDGISLGDGTIPVGLGDGVWMRHEIAPAGHVDGMMKRQQDAMARWGAMDDRIEALVDDMHMFMGEFKIVAMEALLTAIVERQSAMMDEMRQMHGLLTPPMMDRQVPDMLPAWPDEEFGWSDEEPGRMCAPEF